MKTISRDGCDPIENPEALACVASIYGGPMRWRGPDGLVHQVAGTTPAGDIPCEGDEVFILFTACGCWDVPEGATLLGADEGSNSITCPACGSTGGH